MPLDGLAVSLRVDVWLFEKAKRYILGVQVFVCLLYTSLAEQRVNHHHQQHAAQPPQQGELRADEPAQVKAIHGIVQPAGVEHLVQAVPDVYKRQIRQS